jgi:Prealbumin-like fold domain
VKKKLALLLALAGALTTTFFVVGSANANLPGSPFEGNDGNLVVNTPGNEDWDNAPNLSVGQDIATGTNDNSFGQGTKEDLVDVTVVTGSIPNSKADLARFAVAGETLTVGGVQNSFLYLAWSRENQSGTVNFDFEINKAAQPDLTTPGPKTLNRTAGDLLINYAFKGGSNTPTLTLRTWSGTQWGSPTDLGGCSEGKTNADTVSENLGGLTAVDRPAQQFGEASINLTCAGIVPAGACEGFSSAYVKSRSSTSFTSEIKDFIAPVTLHLANCGAIKVMKTTKKPGLTGPQPQAGVTFTLDGSTTGVTDATGSVCFDGLALTSHTVTETVPTGYQADGATTQTVTVDNAAKCSDVPFGGETVSFSNSPLTDVSISVNSQADAGTASSVDCSNNGLDFSTDVHGDGSSSVTGIAGSSTITCTITIDP